MTAALARACNVYCPLNLDRPDDAEKNPDAAAAASLEVLLGESDDVLEIKRP